MTNYVGLVYLVTKCPDKRGTVGSTSTLRKRKEVVDISISSPDVLLRDFYWVRITVGTMSGK